LEYKQSEDSANDDPPAQVLPPRVLPFRRMRFHRRTKGRVKNTNTFPITVFGTLGEGAVSEMAVSTGLAGRLLGGSGALCGSGDNPGLVSPVGLSISYRGLGATRSSSALCTWALATLC